MTETWIYECSICGEAVEPGGLGAHVNRHKGDSDWTGVISFKRIDKPTEEETGA